MVDFDFVSQALDAVRQATDHQGVPEGDEQPGGVERLLEKIKGAVPRRLHRGPDRSVPRNHDHNSPGVGLPDTFQDLEAVHLRELHIEEGHIGLEFRIVDQSGGTVAAQVHPVAFVFEDLSEGLANRLFVVDDQDSCHELGSSAVRM